MAAVGCAYLTSPERLAKAVGFLVEDARLRARLSKPLPLERELFC